jgi:SAM-dependent methyltransferase
MESARSELTAVYDTGFYNEQKAASLRSAEQVVPIIVDVFRPSSVIDVGCGAGGWLRVFAQNGVARLLGYDGSELAEGEYFIDKSLVRVRTDFAADGFAVNERADLLLCLEVAEHLPAACADRFIAALVQASPVIVFSAAFPGQTGVHHVNEQPPWYWREKFERLGYGEIDFIRPAILRNDAVSWWYRQNITCYVRKKLIQERPRLKELAARHGPGQDGCHLAVVNEWVLRKHLPEVHAAATGRRRLPRSGLGVRLSVIIPTRNRCRSLRRTLLSLRNQTYPQEDFEVIVADNGSRDGTTAACQEFRDRFRHFILLCDSRPGLLAGRHAGYRAARGEILVFTDDDIEAFPTWLEGIAEAFEFDRVGLVSGKCLPRFEAPPPAWVAELCDRSELGWSIGWYSLLDFGDRVRTIPHHFVWGCNFSIPKTVFERTGGFHPDALPPELIRFRGDGETAVAADVSAMGLVALYHPKASVYHVVSKERLTPRYVYRRAFNQGISDSYTQLRRGNGSPGPPPAPGSPRSIREIAARGHADGYAFHQEMVRRDVRLRAWVMKDDYRDGEGPPA